MARDHRHHHRRSAWGHLITNWDHYEATTGKKLALALRNLTLGRARHGLCCGHPGQPGC